MKKQKIHIAIAILMSAAMLNTSSLAVFALTKMFIHGTSH